MNMVNCDSETAILGLRPGEAVNCIRSRIREGGCGTSEFCTVCGLVNTAAAALGGEHAVGECRILTNEGHDALDLRVWAEPLQIGQRNYATILISDISTEKRKEIMERIFLHDVLNITGGLLGYSKLLGKVSGDKLPDIKERLSYLTLRIVDEIRYQQTLIRAEDGDLQLHPETIPVIKILEGIQEIYSDHDVAKNKRIRVSTELHDDTIVSDQTLLERVLGNMLKNGLEASEEDDTVTIGCQKVNGKYEFWVHNNAYMPKPVQLQVFQRSFSTKGEGRGLGTYSIKLLTERYLGGEVSFQTDQRKGTTFFVLLPPTLPSG
jgi:signal transduction histidine kinase